MVLGHLAGIIYEANVGLNAQLDGGLGCGLGQCPAGAAVLANYFDVDHGPTLSVWCGPLQHYDSDSVLIIARHWRKARDAAPEITIFIWAWLGLCQAGPTLPPRAWSDRSSISGGLEGVLV